MESQTASHKLSLDEDITLYDKVDSDLIKKIFSSKDIQTPIYLYDQTYIEQQI